MTHPLGLWAAIDIETSGVDPHRDSIIDVGFYQFEGTKLVRSFQSLVRYPMLPDASEEGTEGISQFIQKLTGITPGMLSRAPHWREVELELSQLENHHLMAHNSDFEKGFLGRWINGAQYEDSLLFLGLAMPDRSGLSLESILIDLGLADKEEHRGLSDSFDMLRAVLTVQWSLALDREMAHTWDALWKKHRLDGEWWASFSRLTREEVLEIAQGIDFDVETAYKNWKSKRSSDGREDVAPRDVPVEFSGSNVQKILRDEAGVRSLFPNYVYRKSQEDMALRVGQSFKNKVHSLAQAPTGTGKTLAYLLPSALFALDSGEKVLIATGTKALQHQALEKDIPQLRKILGLSDSKLKIRSLMGSSNHFCELMFREKEKEEVPDLTSAMQGNWAGLYFDLVFFHNARTKDGRPVTRENSSSVLRYKIEGLDQLSKDVAVDFRACLGSRCPFSSDCSYLKGLREARDAHIIIGNHALMFTWPRGLPRPMYVVVDEAHKIEHESTNAFSLEATQADLDNISKALLHLQGVGSLFYLLAQHERVVGDSTPVIRDLTAEIRSQQQMFADNLKGLSELFEAYFKRRPKYSDTYWNEAPLPGGDLPSQDTTAQAIHNRLAGLAHILSNVELALLPHLTNFENIKLEEENQLVAFTRFEAFMGQLGDLHLALSSCIVPKDNYATSWRYHEKDGFALLAAPVDVGRVLHNGLLENSSAVVMTSATLGNAEGDMGAKGVEWSTGYMYTKPERRFKHGLFLPAVYDYKANARVFLCDDVPPTYDALFVEKTLAPAMKLVRDLQGRSLFLYSSRARFEEARERLLAHFEGEIPLFIQGMGANVVEDFKRCGHGILLGMESFGEGIDVPGDALQFIFIDKVPDLRMEWVIDKRREFYERAFGNEFADYYLSHRTRSLHQKLGRLLRTERDHGAVIVVDSRVKSWKGGTWEKFTKLMAPYQVQRLPLKEACERALEFVRTGPAQKETPSFEGDSQQV